MEEIKTRLVNFYKYSFSQVLFDLAMIGIYCEIKYFEMNGDFSKGLLFKIRVTKTSGTVPPMESSHHINYSDHYALNSDTKYSLMRQLKDRGFLTDISPNFKGIGPEVEVIKKRS